MKYTIIRKVPFKLPGFKDKIVWANVLAENQGFVLVVIPKPSKDQPHRIFFATENVTERIFEPLNEFQFHLSTDEFIAAGDRLKILGKQFEETDCRMEMRRLRRSDDDF